MKYQIDHFPAAELSWKGLCMFLLLGLTKPHSDPGTKPRPTKVIGSLGKKWREKTAAWEVNVTPCPCHGFQAEKDANPAQCLSHKKRNLKDLGLILVSL